MEEGIKQGKWEYERQEEKTEREREREREREWERSCVRAQLYKYVYRFHYALVLAVIRILFHSYRFLVTLCLAKTPHCSIGARNNVYRENYNPILFSPLCLHCWWVNLRLIDFFKLNWCLGEFKQNQKECMC